MKHNKKNIDENVRVRAIYLKKILKYQKALFEIANCSEQGNPIYLRKIAREVLKDDKE
tara:strand:- start:17 stop:190 length:174 start_codon:yes stop_codon:yes gene_type:complete